MQGFIEQIAYKLYEKMGDDISSLYIMFPSRRARLFFADTVSKVAQKPLWQPSYISVDDVMTEISGLAKGEHTRLIAELYKIYSQHHNETFDSFYFWGEMLLSDFDAVDKYMIDADMLFSNIADLKEIGSDYSYLTEDQLLVIANFWRSFGLESEFSQEKREFINIWRTLGTIYKAYRQRLSELGVAYSGMIYRRAAEMVESGQIPAEVIARKYVVAGFNALSKSEKVVLDMLRDNASVEFFWDHDDYYTTNREQEAGLFIRENIRRYPQTTTLPHSYRTFADPKQITVVAAPSDSMQCKYVNDFLRSVESSTGRTPDKETAVVLTNENLLLPALYAIPESVDNINITMGYPFRQTLVYSFVERLIELQGRKKNRANKTLFYHSYAIGLLSHPFVMEQQQADAERIIGEITKRQQVYVDSSAFGCGGVVEQIFINVASWQQLSDYILSVSSAVVQYSGADQMQGASRAEYFAVLADNVIRLRNSLEECDLELSFTIYVSLLRRMLQGVRIPYEGEPLAGVQIMGILETRNLDFENLLILSVNDDSFPGTMASSSFIPYNLRYAYDLPTPAHHEGVYAYYFYRLLQRAKNVHLVYCSRSDDKNSGERSRYIHQLVYESPHTITQRAIGLDVNLSKQQAIVVEKTGEPLAKLNRYLNNPERKLSPTAFNSYIDCPLKFYFRVVAGVAQDKEVSEEVDVPMFGSILHCAVELLYKPLIDKPQPWLDIAKMIGKPMVGEAVTQAINQTYLNDDSAQQQDYSGNLILVQDIVAKYLNRCLLPYDAAQQGYTISKIEEPISWPFVFELDGLKHEVIFGGLADRIDTLDNGMVRIVDYKSGKPHIVFDGVEALFGDDPKKHSPAVLQTMLYAMISSQGGRRDVQPVLYYVRDMNSEGYSPLLHDKQQDAKVQRYSDYRGDFESLLGECVRKIFDPTVPFTQCEDSSVCAYCDYNQICRR